MVLQDMKTIPEHKNCNNCGECCGLLIASKNEIKAIEEYLKTLSIFYKEQIRTQSREPLTCQFRDIDNKKCAIYPVRPMVCKLMGVAKGMQCSNGNSAEVDGMQFMDKKYLLSGMPVKKML